MTIGFNDGTAYETELDLALNKPMSGDIEPQHINQNYLDVENFEATPDSQSPAYKTNRAEAQQEFGDYYDRQLEQGRPIFKSLNPRFPKTNELEVPGDKVADLDKRTPPPLPMMPSSPLTGPQAPSKNWWIRDPSGKPIDVMPPLKTYPEDYGQKLGDLQINREHEIPFISGPSKDGKTIYIDKHMPESPIIDAGLAHHETWEKWAMDILTKKGYSDEEAYQIAHHQIAEPIEDSFYRSQGLDIGTVNAFYKKQDRRDEQETGPLPEDLYKKPYVGKSSEEEPQGNVFQSEAINPDVRQILSDADPQNYQAWQKYAMEDKRTIVPEGPGRASGGGGFRVAPEVEKVDRPAIRIGDETFEGNPGESHYHIMVNNGRLQKMPGKDMDRMESGWMTNTGRYVDRVEAMKIAEKAEQVKSKELNRWKNDDFTKKELISEDFQGGRPPEDKRLPKGPNYNSMSDDEMSRFLSNLTNFLGFGAPKKPKK